MTNDISELLAELRAAHGVVVDALDGGTEADHELHIEVADILTTRLAELEAALEPFATCADTYAADQPDSRQIVEREPGIQILRLGNLRRARTALTGASHAR